MRNYELQLFLMKQVSKFAHKPCVMIHQPHTLLRNMRTVNYVFLRIWFIPRLNANFLQGWAMANKGKEVSGNGMMTDVEVLVLANITCAKCLHRRNCSCFYLVNP